MSTKVENIANEILGIAHGRNLSLRSMTLVKLTYIAYGYALMITENKIFTDDIEAWEHGPMIPNLYHSMKQFGHDPIPCDYFSDHGDSEIDDTTKEVLAEVISKYGIFSDAKLSSITHKKGSPWHQAYKSGKNEIIPDRIIFEYYKKKVGLPIAKNPFDNLPENVIRFRPKPTETYPDTN